MIGRRMARVSLTRDGRRFMDGPAQKAGRSPNSARYEIELSNPICGRLGVNASPFAVRSPSLEARCQTAFVFVAPSSLLPLRGVFGANALSEVTSLVPLALSEARGAVARVDRHRERDRGPQPICYLRSYPLGQTYVVLTFLNCERCC
jgi:hypothetical protein